MFEKSRPLQQDLPNLVIRDNPVLLLPECTPQQQDQLIIIIVSLSALFFYQ